MKEPECTSTLGGSDADLPEGDSQQEMQEDGQVFAGAEGLPRAMRRAGGQVWVEADIVDPGKSEQVIGADLLDVEGFKTIRAKVRREFLFGATSSSQSQAARQGSAVRSCGGRTTRRGGSTRSRTSSCRPTPCSEEDDAASSRLPSGCGVMVCGASRRVPPPGVPDIALAAARQVRCGPRDVACGLVQVARRRGAGPGHANIAVLG